MSESDAIKNYFCQCNIILGDFNLSHRIKSDQEKLAHMCGSSKVNILSEITRSISRNQLDYILVDKDVVQNSYATSFNNFISDHKSITVRIGLEQNEFKKDFKLKISFDQESHMKTRKASRSSDQDSMSSSSDVSMTYATDYSLRAMSDSDMSVQEFEIEGITPMDHQLECESDQNSLSLVFKRRFKNVDSATCWLNSALQMLLNAFDYEQLDHNHFQSELGKEMDRLLSSDDKIKLDPFNVKTILCSTEDTRVALRVSEIEANVQDIQVREQQVRAVTKLRFDAASGQQCMRDLFFCLQENHMSWPDISSHFVIRIAHSSVCCSCENNVQSENEQLYLELPVPPDGSNLNFYIEEYFNTSDLVGRNCEDICNTYVQAEVRNQLSSGTDSRFLVVILSRGMRIAGRFHLNTNLINSTQNLFIK